MIGPPVPLETRCLPHPRHSRYQPPWGLRSRCQRCLPIRQSQGLAMATSLIGSRSGWLRATYRAHQYPMELRPPRRYRPVALHRTGIGGTSRLRGCAVAASGGFGVGSAGAWRGWRLGSGAVPVPPGRPTGSTRGKIPVTWWSCSAGVMPYSSARNSWRYRQRCSEGRGSDADRTAKLAHQVGWPAWLVPRDPIRALMTLRLGVAARRAGRWRCRRGPGRAGQLQAVGGELVVAAGRASLDAGVDLLPP